MKSIFAFPISIPLAANSTFATTPVVSILSALSFASTFFITLNESSTFVPPSTKTQGWLPLYPALLRDSTSFSMSLPAILGITGVNPTMERWARWDTPKASFTKISIWGASFLTIFVCACSAGNLFIDSSE